MPRFRMRRVVVKVHIARAGRGGGRSAFGAHVSYIQRDGVDRDGKGGELYSADGRDVSASGFLERSEEDRHQFRLIVSPEDGASMEELRTSTRELMAEMERDLDTRLDWVAVDHHNTGHPHTHIVIRGKDEAGRDLVIAPRYLMKGIRERASGLLTERLGPRRDLEIARARQSEVAKDRFTAVDRSLARDVTNGILVVSGGGSSGDRFERHLKLARLAHLERLHLAQKQPGGAWKMSPGWEDTLRELGRQGDIVRALSRARGNAKLEGPIRGFSSAQAENALTGEFIASLPSDELRDQRTWILRDLDGHLWSVDAGAARLGGEPPEGAIIEARQADPKPRPSDRVIAEIAEGSGGLYSEELHLADDPGSSAAFRLTHKRRLEALRRAGLVERAANGEWTIPGDYLARAARYEMQKGQGIAIHVKSWLSLEAQISADGATWLDTAAGSGQALADAQAARREVLISRGLLAENELKLSDQSLVRLRQEELGAARMRIAAASGRQGLAPGAGETFEGKVEQTLNLAQGRMAVFGNERAFALIPWRPDFERTRGRTLSVEMTRRGANWTFMRGRSKGLSR